MVGTVTVIAVGQVGSLFSADAWNNVTFTAGEVKNPSRNLPLSLAMGWLHSIAFVSAKIGDEILVHAKEAIAVVGGEQ